MTLENTPKVIGQTVRRAKPCSLCGTSKGVTITYAVPLDRGGEASEWNHHVLCPACRLYRKRKHWHGSAAESALDAELS